MKEETTPEENQGTNEENKEKVMKVLHYDRSPFFVADWRSPRSINRIMRSLADQVVKACLGNNSLDYLLGKRISGPDLKVEYKTETWLKDNLRYPPVQRPRKIIKTARVYDKYGSIDAIFAYFTAIYAYPHPTLARLEYGGLERPPTLESRAEIWGKIKYNPEFFKRTEDVERLKDIVKK